MEGRRRTGDRMSGCLHGEIENMEKERKGMVSRTHKSVCGE
jgi:hypothetical protein